MMDEPIDRRLHDAGGRLRDAAPTVATTDAVLDTLDGRTMPSIRWIAPLVLAVAAAVVGVLVLSRPEEIGRVAPADGGPQVVAAPTTTALPSTTSTAPPTTATPAPPTAVTVAPTTSPTVTTTTPPAATSTTSIPTPPTTTGPTFRPPVRPAFAGDLPLEASAAIVGCPGTFGDLAAAVPPESWPIVSLACAGDHAVAVSATHPDGSNYELLWTSAGGWDNEGSGTSHPCDPAEPSDICAAFGEPAELYDVDRPLPPAWLVEDPNHRPAVDATDVVTALGVSAGDTEAFAVALGEALQAITSGDPVPRVEHEVLESVPVVAVTLRGIPDDSSSRLTYVVRYADVDGRLAPLDALSFVYCDRGVTNDGLCL